MITSFYTLVLLRLLIFFIFIIATFSGPNTCYDVIMWMDHRAKEQAELINSDKHAVLRYVGGKMSLEMQPPKLLWLKQVNCLVRGIVQFSVGDN